MAEHEGPKLAPTAPRPKLDIDALTAFAKSDVQNLKAALAGTVPASGSVSDSRQTVPAPNAAKDTSRATPLRVTKSAASHRKAGEKVETTGVHLVLPTDLVWDVKQRALLARTTLSAYVERLLREAKR